MTIMANVWDVIIAYWLLGLLAVVGGVVLTICVLAAIEEVGFRVERHRYRRQIEIAGGKAREKNGRKRHGIRP